MVFIPISGKELLKPLEFPKGVFGYVNEVTFGKPLCCPENQPCDQRAGISAPFL